MTTPVDDVVQTQMKESVLHAPTTLSPTTSSSANSTMSVALVNNTSSYVVYAYITGLATDNNSAVFLLESDGTTVYYPASPSTTGKALSSNCAIQLGAPGSTTIGTIPRTAGGRIWFSRDAALTFLLNPGPGLVEPSVTNESDPNYGIYWEFCEFTFNSAELFVTISYVDFACLPIGLQLENTSGTITTVEGLPPDGLDTVCAGLVAQTATDGADWSDLIIKSSSGANLRALSPNSGITMNSSLFPTYFDDYAAQVWAKYSGSSDLTVDTQASWGVVDATVSSDNLLSFGSSVGSFAAPSSANIFSCSSGPFATSSDQMGAIAARLAAAFNRSTLLLDAIQPNDEVVADYYQHPVTNHYARLLHATYLDGKGYAFPYDDVAPADGADQSGSLFDANPALLTITFGGPSSSSEAVRLREVAARTAPRGLRQGQHQRLRRNLVGWAPAEDEKRMLSASDRGSNSADADLEKSLDHGISGEGAFLLPNKDARHQAVLRPSSSTTGRGLASFVPQRWAEQVAALVARLESSPAYASLTRSVVGTVVRLFSLCLSFSVKTVVSRVAVALFLVLFYLFLPLSSGGDGDHIPGLVDCDSGSPAGLAVVDMASLVNTTVRQC